MGRTKKDETPVERKTISGSVPVELLNAAEDIAFSESRVRKISDLINLALTEYVERRAEAPATPEVPAK